MPVYEYKCADCDVREDRLEDKPSGGWDCQCGGYMVRVWSFSVKRSGQEMPPGSH